MKPTDLYQYVYPAVFVNGEDEIAVVFPDLNISTEGETFEQAFLLAKDYLRVYCTYSLKYGLDMPSPSFYIDVKKHNPKDSVMLIDTLIFPSDLK